MTTFEALEVLENTPNGKARAEKLGELLKEVPALATVLRYAMSPDITFGVKQIPEPKHDDRFLVLTLVSLLENLRTREWTGQKARDAIAHYLWQSDDLNRKWVPRIIKQDLRLNIDAKTVNKVAPGTITVFAVPLAHPMKEAKPKHLKGTFAVQKKADGGRCVAHLPAFGGEVTLYSRTGKVWENFESIRKTLNKFNEHLNADVDYYIDGEVVSFVDGKVDFNAIQQTMMAKKRKTEVGTLHYLVFDMATAEEWFNPTDAYQTRYNAARTILAEFDQRGSAANVSILPWEDVVTDPTLESVKPLHDKLVAEGWEGLILRRIDLPVVLKRDFRLMKVKEFSDDEAEILAIEPGEGRLADSMGQVLCRSKGGITFRCGGGFSDTLRKKMWLDPERYIGRWFTFTYFGMTMEDGSFRHPNFKYWRSTDDF